MQVKIKKLSERAEIPVYGTQGAACFDLKSDINGMLPARHSALFPIGLSFEIPTDHVMLIFSRSGHGFKYGLRLANCVGVIDSDYRGEVMVKMHNDSDDDFLIVIGQAIAQALIMPVQQIQFIEADALSDTERGENGLGSTGI